jgi:uncharacterized protein (TIGR03435 family)
MTGRAPRIPNRSRTSLLLIAIPILLAAPIAHAQSAVASSPDATQSQPPPTRLPIFAVSVIRPNNGGSNIKGSMSSYNFTPSGLEAINVTPQTLLRVAFNLEDNQILETPAWAKSERFDLQTKVDAADAEALKSLTREQRTQMLQQLLEDRFKLKSHFETRDLPMYSLITLKTGAKVKEVQPVVGPDGKKSSGGAGWGNGEIKANAIAIDQFAHILTQQLDRTVINKTNLPANYDFTLKWALDDSTHTDATGPSIFTAVQEQLGLKLEPGKAPIQVLVIDHIEHPSEN